MHQGSNEYNSRVACCVERRITYEPVTNRTVKVEPAIAKRYDIVAR